MKNFTTSKAVNHELAAMATRQTVKKSVSVENKVFIALGALLLVSIVINVLVNGIPNI